MNAQKFNFKKRIYAPYVLPEGASCFEADMSTEISCAQCGKTMMFADGYTSRQIHTKIGFGFSVCEECYTKEWNEERKYQK